MSVRWPAEWDPVLRPVASVFAGLDGEVGDLDPALLAGPPPADLAWADAAPEAVRPLALDRWRRAAGEALVGLLRARDGLDDAAAWDAADRHAPALGLLWPALVDLRLRPEEGLADAPRAAWWARFGPDPSPARWLAFARWIFDAERGPAVGAPLPLPAADPLPAPAAWNAASRSFRRVALVGGPAGARLRVTGGLAAPVALAHEQRAVVVVASAEGGAVSCDVEPLGPVGRWTLRVGRLDGRLGAARGIELELREDGVAEVTLADAFVGPASEGALDLASKFGVSGLLTGRWRVAAVVEDRPVVELAEARAHGVTVHPRGRRGFAMPAGPILGAAQGVMARVGGTRWRVRPVEGGIEAESADLGRQVTLVFGRAQ